MIERLDERLRDRNGSVKRAGIPPCFEIMCLGKVPLAKARGFILEETQMKAEQAGLLLDQFTETKLGRRRESRIAAQDDEEFNLVLLDCLDQLVERLHMIDRPS